MLSDPEVRGVMNKALLHILLIVLLSSCDSYVPYPELGDEDALLRLECVAGESDSTVVYVSREFLISHDHRTGVTEYEDLNSSLRFTVNGDVKDYVEDKGINDTYTIHHHFEAGDRIEVSCSAPGMPDVKASVVVPEIPEDLVEDFRLTRDGMTITGNLVMNHYHGNGIPLTPKLHVRTTRNEYQDGILVSSGSGSRDIPFVHERDTEWSISYDLPVGKEYKDPMGKTIRTEVLTDAMLKISVPSKELYYGRLHQIASPMSPSSYTNVEGGLGYVGAVNHYIGEIFTFGQQ